jgi:HPt (histidine-containing phosphotransfer) domain-containing protein
MMEAEVVRDLQPLIPRFLENRVSEVAAALEFLRAEDFVSLDRYGHSLKGLCQGYGFAAMIPIAEEIQAAAIARSAERISAAVEAIRTYFSTVSVRYVDRK